MHYKVIIIKTMWYFWKDRHWSRNSIEDPKLTLTNTGQIILNKGNKGNSKGKKLVFSTNGALTIGHQHAN